MTYLLRWLRRPLRRPSFLDGAGSVLDLGGVLGPEPELAEDPAREDGEAIRSDWERVGASMKRAWESSGVKAPAR